MTIRTGILIVVGVIAAAIGLSALGHRIADERRQDALDAFYATPAGIEDAALGAVLRVESLPAADVDGGTAYRLLYRTERPNGSAAVSGAMAFVPTEPAPAGGRPVLAYAHGTIGQGRGCAPSRRQDPLGPNETWVSQAVRSGFAVVATDYAGIGTAGPNLYLVGAAEARDVVNAVRALDGVPGASPGRDWVVFGHSQGGHSALWTGQLGPTLLPDHRLRAVAAAAPAADLPLIIDSVWDSGIGWGVGAEVAQSWPYAYPSADPDAVVSSWGKRWTGRVADACLGEGIPVPALLGFASAAVGVPYYRANPLGDPSLADIAARETPSPLPSDLPLLVAQGTGDAVIPPRATAALQETWCARGSDLSMLWLGGIGHVDALKVAGPAVVSWLTARVAGVEATRTCDGAPPIAAPVPPYRDVLHTLD